MKTKYAAALVLASMFSAAFAQDRVPIRSTADSARGLRWDLAWDSLSVYDAPTSRLIQRFPIDAIQVGNPGIRAPGLALDRQGAAIVASNITPTVWRIDPASLAVERFDLALDSDHDRDFGFAEFAWNADGTVLHAASSVGAGQWRLDLQRRVASKCAPLRGC